MQQPQPREFSLIKGISTQMATPSSTFMEYIKQNIKLGLPNLIEVPEVKPKTNRRIALVGGGPSINRTKLELAEFDHIVACGSAHDWCMTNGFVPKWSIHCDPDPITNSYLTKLSTQTQFFVASHCHPSTFEHLKGMDVRIWHCFSENLEELRQIIPHTAAIGGGCTVGLRSLSIAVVLGYSDIHFFGFDSCVGDSDETHGYTLSSDDKTLDGIIHNIKIGDVDKPTDKTYRCLGYQLAQAVNFKDFYYKFNSYFTPTFHGGGMISDFYDLIKEETKRVELEQEADKKVING